ncbi:perlucin-like protein [Simochromis diagramma]|uniref:perlucin-like protein n=1 Tax=Simochromis diagramma TaxID=43689 RepID=UPI001A7EAA9A|nr:perlucin-like protein [Simochromis diagramma]
MHLIQKKATLGIKGLAILCAVLGLFANAESAQDANNTEGELTFLKLKLESLKDRFRHMCSQYSDLAHNCSAPAINCTECPDRWVHVGDHCFFLSNDNDGWLNSTLKCKDIGGHLAILTTKEEHDALEKEARTIGTFNPFYWLGLSDIENEGDWKWVDNSTLQVSFWNTLKSEPDNNASAGEAGEDCAVVDTQNQNWYDVPCSFQYRRICQMDAIPLN